MKQLLPDAIRATSGALSDQARLPHLESGRPRMGGLAAPVQFAADHVAVIEAIADTLIPGGGGFPAPSEVGIVNFFGRYTTPSGYSSKHYPFVEEDSLKAALERLSPAFVGTSPQVKVAQMAVLEHEEHELFERLRGLVYYGYYASAEVTIAIQHQLPAGKDYHGPPLPYGYAHCIEDWDDEALSTAGSGGTYIPTDSVVRVDLTKLEWLNRGRGNAK